jgi:alginate O-acetyltransferase complex protein AlgI
VLFTQLSFLLFFLVCFSTHWMLPQQRARKFWLLACSYFFYGWWDARFLLLIFAATAMNYLAASALARAGDPHARRAWLTLGLISSLGVLGFFKYYGFFIASASELLRQVGLDAGFPVLHVILPVGISFFTFQAMSYTIDVYRGTLAPTRSFFDFALYISFVPQLVAGPIVRASHFLPQLDLIQRFADVNVRRYLLLFLVGFFKKACVSDNLATSIDPVFGTPLAFGSIDLALAALGYTIQIYCDFSGNSDMAIALAGLLGYRLVLNFDFPYFSRNVREFWRRWHISLSTWLRDYLYVPLGGSRHGSVRTQRNLLITMVLGGLWHGAAPTFVVWGALHGLALLVHRTWSRVRPAARVDRPGARLLCVGLTFAWVVLCFTIFRSESLTLAGQFIAKLFSFAPTDSPSLGWRFVLLYTLLAGVHLAAYHQRERLQRFASGVSSATFSVAYGAACWFVAFFTPTNASPFIYFQF